MKRTGNNNQNHKVETRFRNFNLLFFILISVVMMAVMGAVVGNIAQRISKDYARFYAAQAIGTLNTHLNREIALVNKAVSTKTIVDWFADESDEGKRERAYLEMMDYIEVLYSSNLYFGIDKSLNEFSIVSGATYEEFAPFSVLDTNREKDQWYFECINSENPYVFNVDIDKQQQRKLVWLNHKVVSDDGEILGVFCSGLKFDQVIEQLFDEYDNNSVWGLVIDENGMVQMDSSISNNSERLIFGETHNVAEYYNDPVFNEVIQSHLSSIDGFFESVPNPTVYELSEGSFNYVSIAPIESTNWSVVTFYNSKSLFTVSNLYPLLLIILAFFIVYIIVVQNMNHRIIFRPFHRLISSISGKEEQSNIYGLQRKDEIGDLARTINDMKERLDTYNADLLEAMEQSTKANKSKSVFLANMSHEIRTPLNAIIGMSQIVRKVDDPKRIQECMGKIENASNHLLGVINDILDMSKIEAGKLEMVKIKFDFVAMIQNAADIMAIQMQGKNQQFKLEIDERISYWIVSDEKHLSQVVVNLLSNAVKFTPEGGLITLTAQQIGDADDSCLLRVAVTDKGIGISSEQQKRLFQNFEQADSSTARKYGGTGLGLAISKNIVEMLGGEMLLESEIDKGSCFSFTICAEKVEASPELSYTELSENAGSRGFVGKRMLLVEDIEINREIMSALLEDTGISIECAVNGEEAVNIIKQHPKRYDIILMDIQMPVMDGYTASRLIRELPQAKDIPIIAMTANVYSEDVEKCINAGMNDHLGKPIEVDKVVVILNKYLLSKPT